MLWLQNCSCQQWRIAHTNCFARPPHMGARRGQRQNHRAVLFYGILLHDDRIKPFRQGCARKDAIGMALFDGFAPWMPGRDAATNGQRPSSQLGGMHGPSVHGRIVRWRHVQG